MGEFDIKYVDDISVVITETSIGYNCGFCFVKSNILNVLNITYDNRLFELNYTREYDVNLGISENDTVIDTYQKLYDILEHNEPKLDNQIICPFKIHIKEQNKYYKYHFKFNNYFVKLKNIAIDFYIKKSIYIEILKEIEILCNRLKDENLYIKWHKEQYKYVLGRPNEFSINGPDILEFSMIKQFTDDLPHIKTEQSNLKISPVDELLYDGNTLFYNHYFTIMNILHRDIDFDYEFYVDNHKIDNHDINDIIKTIEHKIITIQNNDSYSTKLIGKIENFENYIYYTSYGGALSDKRDITLIIDKKLFNDEFFDYSTKQIYRREIISIDDNKITTMLTSIA